MQEFIAKHREEIAGVLSGFDRLVFRGTLRSISYGEGMLGYRWAKQVRLTEFGSHVLPVSERLKQACKAKAEALGRPVKYLDAPQFENCCRRRHEICRTKQRDLGLVVQSSQGTQRTQRRKSTTLTPPLRKKGGLKSAPT